MSLASYDSKGESPKLCDCEGCTNRRFAMLAKIESYPENKAVCEALPEQNSPTVTTLQ